MRVLFDPKPDERGSGVTSSVTWDNPELYEAMRTLFHIKDQYEELESIEVSHDGIIARVRQKKLWPASPGVRMVKVRGSVSVVPGVGAARKRRKP